MTTVLQSQSRSTAHQLADWLALKNSQPSLLSKLEYHLVGRAALVGTSLLSLAEAVGRVALGSIALLGYLVTLGFWQQAKAAGVEQMQKASHSTSISYSCFCSILSPKDLASWLKPIREPRGHLTPEMRAQQVIHGAELIADKLQKQYERAQNQAAQESDKAFRYLTAPRSFLGQAHTERVSGYEVGVCHYIGRRPTMEDEHLATAFDLNIQGRVYPVQLFGVFDGHAGNEASIYLKQNLKRELQRTLHEFCSNGLTDEAIWNALKITFFRLDTNFRAQSGSTATMAMILNGKLWTANVGDSRTILDNGIQLSEDAKPDDPYYKKGIENRGGAVFHHRINGNLAVARAVGDHSITGVCARPKITACPLAGIPPGSHLVLTCDGIYDVSSTRQVAAAVQAHKARPAEELARNIVYSAYEAQSGDNLSALVVKM